MLTSMRIFSPLIQFPMSDVLPFAHTQPPPKLQLPPTAAPVSRPPSHVTNFVCYNTSTHYPITNHTTYDRLCPSYR